MSDGNNLSFFRFTVLLHLLLCEVAFPAVIAVDYLGKMLLPVIAIIMRGFGMARLAKDNKQRDRIITTRLFFVVHMMDTMPCFLFDIATFQTPPSEESPDPLSEFFIEFRAVWFE